MSPAAPRSIDAYLAQLRAALAGQDPALVQDATYDAEEYLRAEIAAHPDKSEADVLELIASTYGAPEEVAAAYRETEAKVKEALRPPPRPATAAQLHAALLQRLHRSARLHLPLLYGAVARHRHRVLHDRGHGHCGVVRARCAHHWHPVLPRLHWHRACNRARRGTPHRGHDRRAHAAPAGAPRAENGTARADRRNAEGQPHLDDPRLLHPHAAAWHPVLHPRH